MTSWKAAGLILVIGLAGCSSKKEIPSLAGLDLDRATAALQARGLAVGRVEKSFGGGNQPLGTVLQQDPAPSARVPKGTLVNLVVEDFVVVPNFVGRDYLSAREALVQTELTVAELRQTPGFDKEAAGKIINQAPEMGTKVPRGSAIALEVAQPPQAETATANGSKREPLKEFFSSLLAVGQKELEKRLEDSSDSKRDKDAPPNSPSTGGNSASPPTPSGGVKPRVFTLPAKTLIPPRTNAPPPRTTTLPRATQIR
jgi:beta-lactam-binding protein with PASTA domain